MRFFISLFLFIMVLECSAQSPAGDSISDLVRKGDTIALAVAFKKDPAAVNMGNANGHTPLLLAAYKGNLPVVKFLLGKGADVNFNSRNGTVLHGASYKGQYDIVELLLQKGAKVNVQDENGTTPLMYAILSRNVKLVSLLIQKGADTAMKDKLGKTALDFANASGDKKLISLFEKK